MSKLMGILLILGVGIIGMAGYAHQTKAGGYQEVSAEEAKKLIAEQEVFILDVREPDEFAQGHLPNSKLIPTGEISQRLDEISKDKALLVVCRSGRRSGIVSKYLVEKGYIQVYNLQGGVTAWIEKLEK